MHAILRKYLVLKRNTRPRSFLEDSPKVVVHSVLLLQPPLCNSIARRRRDAANDDEVKGAEGLDGTPATIEVYSGLYVNEASDVGSKSDFSDDVFRERVSRLSTILRLPTHNFTMFQVRVNSAVINEIIPIAIFVIGVESRKADEKEDPFSSFQAIDDPNTICISQRSFAIGIAIAGLILMLAVVAAILVLLAKRRHKSVSTTGSSIYSGPYTNTAYSHSS